MLLLRSCKSNFPISVQHTFKCIIIGKLLTWVTGLEVELKNKEIVLEIHPFGGRYPCRGDPFQVEETMLQEKNNEN